MKLKTNEIGMNHNVFIFEKPRMLIPISSGNGDAIISPPTKRDAHLKSLSLNKTFILFHVLRWLINSKICSENLSLMNRKIIRSPIIAPNAPKRATYIIEFILAISPSATIAGAVVKIEVKNKPAIKLPKNSNSCADASTFAKISVFTKTAAIPMLTAIINTSCNKKP